MWQENKKGGYMKFLLALVIIFSVSFISCDQEPVTAVPDFTTPAAAFVELLVKGDYANAFAKFDVAMKDAMPVEQIEAAWQSLLANVGGFEKIVAVRQAKEQGYDVVYVTCAFDKSQLNVKVVYNDKKEVSGLWFLPM
jgi:hypothetical protein